MEKCDVKQHQRARRLIKNAINKFKLDLTGLTIFTEAASNNYVYTPIIAALAGAEKVYAVTRDSRYAPAEEVIRNTLLLAGRWGVVEHLDCQTSREPDLIHEADIVTNLGFVRPIDKWFVSHMKETAVIPLMFETWEYREQDVDLAACRKRKIAVLGTNEKIKGLETFVYIGNLAIKLAYELGIEVFKSKIVVVGGGPFGESAVKAFVNAGASVANFRISEGDTLFSREFKKKVVDCDLVVFVEYESKELLLGDGGQLSVVELLNLNPGVSIVHVAGNVQEDAIKRGQIPYCPTRLACMGYMSVTTAYLGPKPVIDLHTAGLKVGELMVRARLRGLSITAVKKYVLQYPICQDFSDEQKKRFRMRNLL